MMDIFQANLKIARRNLLKDVRFTLLNVIGLSAGLACTLLIFLWISDELSYDKIFANNDRLYKLFEQRGPGGDIYSEESSGRLSDAIKESVPGVEFAAAVAPPGWFAQNTLSANDKNIKASGQYAEKDYFQIFSFPFIEGNAADALARNNSIVLSDELAMKLFGTNSNLIGKAVSFDHDTTFSVSGVFKKMPANSSQQFDFVLSFDYFRRVKTWVTNWGSKGPLNYMLLKPGVSVDAFNNAVRNIINRNTQDTATKVVAIPFSYVYLHDSYNGNVQNGGKIQYVRLFGLLAIFVLIIACVNFMNLSTAKAAPRFKEVGIKKVVGAQRYQLIMQFLAESLMMAAFAMILAVLITWLLLPAFDQITGKTIHLHFTWRLLMSIICITLITGLLAGSYPAFYLSKFSPLTVLKGKLPTSLAEILSRRGLVVFQFTLSTMLIIAVVIIYQQIQFIQQTDPGYKKDNVLRLPAEGNLATQQDAFLTRLKEVPGVTQVSTTNHRMVGHNYSTGLGWPGKSPDDDTYFEAFETDYEFVETMGMHIIQGRSFSKDYGTDSSAIILNEAAVQAMHFTDPIGRVVGYSGKIKRVIGVVRDFHFESMHSAVKPSFLVLVPGGATIVARVSSNNQQSAIDAIQHVYAGFNPGFPFTFNFLDEAYQQQYVTETRVSILSKYFASLAVIISCLGLFGLAAFTAQRKRKEIGIRKVVGASTINITAMLSGEFLFLVGISLFIALPASWWCMNAWLQSFAYRIQLNPVVFLSAGAAMLVITLCTISFQAVNAAMANPVKSLRTE